MAFHSYTHLIGKLFNAYPCGPPSRVTGTSSWTCVDHSVSRLPPLTRRPIQTRFRCGYATPVAQPCQGRQLVGSLCKRHAVTPKGAPTACRRTVSGTLSLPCAGCFSPFPHGTGSLSVSHECLALPDGPGGFTQDYTCPALLRVPLGFTLLRVRGCHPLWPDFPDGSTRKTLAISRPYYPDGAGTPSVWAVPRSLATTGGITVVFSSSGY